MENDTALYCPGGSRSMGGRSLEKKGTVRDGTIDLYQRV